MKNFFKRQKGVTLIELIIVVIVVGLLAIVGAKSFSNSGVSDNARAQALFEGSTKLSQNAVLLAQAAGSTSAYTSSPLAATGFTLTDALIGGAPYFNSTSFPNAFSQSGISPLTDVAQGTPGSGSYTIATYAMTMSGGGAVPHRFAFAAVPDAVVQALVTKYGSGNTITATADTTNGTIQYAAPTAGARTVTIIKQL